MYVLCLSTQPPVLVIIRAFFVCATDIIIKSLSVLSVACHYVAKKQLLGRDVAEKIANSPKRVVQKCTILTLHHILCIH